MKNHLVLLIALFMSFACSLNMQAQQVEITGSVKNSKGEHINDAIVRLQNHPEISTTTSSNGIFTLSGIIVSIQEDELQNKCMIEGGIIKVLCINEPLNMQLYNITGALIYKIAESGNINGYYQYDINKYLNEVGIYLVKINIGNSAYIYKFFKSQNNLLNGHLEELNTYKSANANDEVDYIEITHDQYKTKIIALNSYTVSLGDIVLESNISVPDAPINFNAQAESSSQINLSWTDNSDNETGFIIEIGTLLSNGSYMYSELANVGSNVNSFQHTGLSAGTTYKYGLYAYNSSGKSASIYANATTEAESRSITLINNSPTSVKLTDIVQVKIASNENGVYTRSDLLTNDPAQCLSLPGESIEPGKSRTFDISIGSNYSVYIGIGCWDLNNVTCSYLSPWFKCTFFTTPTWDTYYVWTVINVTGHESGNWDWTISGSYLTGTLNVKPAGNNSIYFQRTSNNPIQ